MDDQVERWHKDEQISQFVQYLSLIATRLVSPPPDELVRFVERLGDMGPRAGRPFIEKPVTFYRMSGFLYRNPSPTMGELSQAVSVPLSTATRMADRWVEGGYAQRLADPDDRRIVRIALTDKGRRLHEIMEGQIELGFSKALDCLTAAEQESLLGLIRKVADKLVQE